MGLLSVRYIDVLIHSYMYILAIIDGPLHGVSSSYVQPCIFAEALYASVNTLGTFGLIL